jgi:hypothetical protein
MALFESLVVANNHGSFDGHVHRNERSRHRDLALSFPLVARHSSTISFFSFRNMVLGGVYGGSVCAERSVIYLTSGVRIMHDSSYPSISP